MSDALIDRLGELAGLASEYWDTENIRHAPAVADRRAALAELGWPVGDDAALAQAIEQLAGDSWHRALPPVQVEAEGAPFAVSAMLPAGEAVAWRLEFESGGLLDGVSQPDPAAERRTVGDVMVERRSIALPPLPAGYHRLSLPGNGTALSLIAVPAACHLPSALEEAGRVWGLAVQLYSIRSARNWGIGDYSDLARLAERAGAAGADIIGVNPLHARSLCRPEDCSPYAPVSRLALDTLALDVEALPEFQESEAAQKLVAAPEFRARLAALRATPLVDYAGVGAVKLPVLRLLFEAFERDAPEPRRRAHADFIAAGGVVLLHYAQFEALRAWHDARDGRQGWQGWGPDPAADDPRLAPEIAFQLWLQFVADEQLVTVEAAARQAGMRVGLYRDLAVGAARDSAEAWALPALASGLSIGAPPDAMSRGGQNWGLPAPDPRALAEAGFGPSAALLRANMRHAGALRIDHAMSLARLFVIPPGRSGEGGTYLAYPFAALSGVLALESRRYGCLVVGEDLGTVPAGFREAMAARQVLSYKVLVFERYPDGAFRAPADYAHLALATAATHDLPPLAGWWQGIDIRVRQQIGVLPDIAAAEADRRRERERLLVLFEWQKVLPNPRPDPANPTASTQAVLDAIHRLIARAGAAIAMIQLDDMQAETQSVNIPGTSREYPNWRRKLALDIEDPEFEARFAAAAAIFRAERPR